MLIYSIYTLNNWFILGQYQIQLKNLFYNCTVCDPWSGRKRRERVFLSLEEEQRAEICPVTVTVPFS